MSGKVINDTGIEHRLVYMFLRPKRFTLKAGKPNYTILKTLALNCDNIHPRTGSFPRGFYAEF